MTHDPNRPTGSIPPERDRITTPPPEYRDPVRGGGGNSAMALIVGALAVALIIGAFFWFAGDTQDTATLDDPAVVEEDLNANETLGTEEEALGTEEETNEQNTDVTVVTPDDEEEAVIDETQEPAATEETQEEEEVIDETQQQ